MQKHETTFCASFHRKLDSAIYVEKTANPFRSGTPDFYYEGPSGKIIWVEYKWINQAWTTNRTTEQICASKNWPLQHRWLTRAHHNQILTFTIIGVGKGQSTRAYILEYPYEFQVTVHPLFTIPQLVDFFSDLLLR